ncbi:MAG: hypothetical protein A2Y93_09095, partial [Chloroflexi bacterium RBG_13_68_17]
MRTKTFVLLGASLILILGFSSCSFPAVGGGTATDGGVEPGGSAVPAELGAPGAPTNTDGAETILIPGGTFWMGSEDWDAEAEADERPRHQVTLGGFRIYTHEVTHAMYARCVEARVCIPVSALPGGPTSHYGDPAFDDYPVSGVDWLMARDYCAWANARLPTEAEWELASRSTDSLRFPWGEQAPTCDRVNMFGCSVPPDTLAVGSLADGNSAYEVWDLSGNVWEWVHDWYDEDAYFFSSVINPLGPNYSETKVVRGGGLYSEPSMMRAAARQSADPNRPYDDVGFRCVALSDLDLPGDYVPVDPGHLRVPPDSLEGGGERVEDYDPDPDVFFELRWIGFGCPNEEEIAFAFDFSASAPVTFTASVDGVPFECDYAPPSGIPLCEGPIPAAYGVSDSVVIVWHFEGEGIDVSGAWPVPLPEGCEGGGTTRPSVSTSIDCPAAGLVHPHFISSPAIVWDLVQLTTRTDTYDLSCSYTSDAEAVCIAPDESDGGQYWFNLHGTAPDGSEVAVRDFRIAARADCPAEEPITSVTPFCFLEEHPIVSINYAPSTRVVTSVTADGSALRCIPGRPTGSIGHEICGDLSGDPGTPVTVGVCFEGEGCREWEDVPVPACPGTETEPRSSIVSTCLPSVGPVVIFRLTPADHVVLVSAKANGTDLTCLDEPGGGLMCPLIPSSPGSELDVEFCLAGAGGYCYSLRITVPACEEDVPSGGEWSLVDFGCHSETHIYFIADTFLEWLVPLVPGAEGFMYRASDGIPSYSCDIHPTIPGRLY